MSPTSPASTGCHGPLAAQECPYGLLAHQSHQRAQSNVEQQNEQKDVQRVLERRRQDAVPFLVLVAVHSAAAACVAAAHALRNQPFEHKINAEARGQAPQPA